MANPNPPSELERTAADQQVKALQKDVDYDTKDFTIDYIIQEFQNDDFYIPEYQRKFVWDDQRRCKFIESVLLGLPIPFVFLGRDG